MSTEPLLCVGGLVVDDDGRVFVQRHSPDRPVFPSSWDIVGGQVAPDETLESALDRAITQKTGWRLFQILGTVGEYAYLGDDGAPRLETDFLVRVEGDLSRPRLEAGRYLEPRWLNSWETPLLDDPPGVDGDLIRRIVEDAFSLVRRILATD